MSDNTKDEMKDVKKNQRVLKIDAFNDFIDKNNFVGFTSKKITTSMKNDEEKKNVIYPSKWQMINHIGSRLFGKKL